MNRQPRTFLFECERLRVFCFGSRFCAECAPLISLCVEQAMGSLGRTLCGCCGTDCGRPPASKKHSIVGVRPQDHPRGFVLICEDCLDKSLNVYRAQKSFQLLFRTSRAFSSSAVAYNIGACLAQHWTVRELMKPGVWNRRQHWRP